MLSDEQMACVTGAGVADWEVVERPTGRMPLPEWVRGAHVEWMNGAANAPTVKLKVAGDVYAWSDQRWTREGKKCYIARHDDGRARVLYHDGAVTPAAAWRVFAGDEPFTYRWIVPGRCQAGESWEDAARREGQKHLDEMRAATFQIETFGGKRVTHEICRLVVKTMNVTTEQGGSGGDGYLLPMVDGGETMLRGPWHGGAPAGYVEVSTWDSGKPPSAWERRRERCRPWYLRGGQAGLYITEDLYLRIMATHCAHASIARVEHSYGWRLEPFRAEWGTPKSMVYDLELDRARRKEPAGEFWRVYWDGTGRHCGRLRVPTYGYRDEVTDRVAAEVDL